MSADAHSTIAGRELLGIIHELEVEEEAIRDHNKVKSDIIKEAGGKGWDKKTIRKVMAARRLDPQVRDEQDDLFDMYMQAVETAEKSLVHARVENAGKFGAAKPVEPTQEQPVEPASQSETVDQIREVPTVASAEPVEPPANEYAGTSSDENPAPIPHSPASQASQALQADKTSEAVAPPAVSLVANSDDDVPSFLKKDKQPNPDCQKPGSCKWDHSQISCSTCQQAADQRRARAA